jgi:hypothetical protein
VSLLDRDTVSVQPRSPADTAYGPALEPSGEPVTVVCGVRALSTSETAALGYQTRAAIRILARVWPGDGHSLVAWRGGDWEPVGLPLPRTGSPSTAHHQIDCLYAG